ncbi:MAG: RDD family protein [Candidatus Acidiferrales bacterium]
MTEKISDASGHCSHLLSATKFLRLVSLIFVGLSVVFIYALDVRQIGGSMTWKDGNTFICAGSDPTTLIWAALSTALFVVLMVRKPSAVSEGVPSRKRRILAVVIDLWFSALAVVSVTSLIPLWVEAARTGHFSWYFQRDYSVPADILSGLAGLLCWALIILYFAFPLMIARQTVGCFIMRLRVAPPFGDEGSFTFKAALMRTYYAFIGLVTLTLLTRNRERDEQGRTWYDRKTSCTVVLVNDD